MHSNAFSQYTAWVNFSGSVYWCCAALSQKRGRRSIAQEASGASMASARIFHQLDEEAALRRVVHGGLNVEQAQLTPTRVHRRGNPSAGTQVLCGRCNFVTL